MKLKPLTGLLLVFVLFAVFAATAHAVPVTIESVEVNGDELKTTDQNKLDLVRGQDLDVKIRINATGNGSDVEVRAFVSGFEFNREDPISDVTPVFDVDAGVTYIKRLKLRLPDLAEEDNYLLRIIIADRFGSELIQSYRIRIDVPRHSVAIKDVVLNPDNTVIAGRALLVTVRVKNMGEQDEEGIKIKVAIPELGVSASDFIDELEADESTTSEELYLRIPLCAKPGDYSLKATVEFNEGFSKVSTTKNVEVELSDSCSEQARDKTVIIVSSEPQQVTAGGAGAVYPITINNAGAVSRTYTLTVEGVDEWGSVRLSPSNVVAAKPAEVKTVSLFVSAKPDAAAGDRTFVVTVKDQAGNVLEQLNMRASVAAKEAGFQLGGMRKYLEVGLIALVVLLAVIALVVVLSRVKGREDEEPESKTYY